MIWSFIVSTYCLLSILWSFYYIYIIRRYINGWNDLPEFKIDSGYLPVTNLSIVVAARNETGQIQDCIESILRQEYPSHLFELIVVDDHSTDDTVQKIKPYLNSNVKLIELARLSGKRAASKTGKKMAIETAIAQARGKLIVTTDADCTMEKEWLRHLVACYEIEGAKFIAAPVNFYKEKSALEKFQSLDFLGMMCVTGAGIHKRFMHMCNGANLAYEKAVFNEVNGFEGIRHIASGDDMLLMHKIIQKYPNQIKYVKSKKATVYTEAKPNLRAFINQRVRWTTKSKSYQEWSVILILSMVFFFCCSMVLNLLLTPFFGVGLFLIFLFQILVKGIMDYFFLKNISNYFSRADLMKTFFPSFFMHIAYIVGIGILGNLVKKYRWKDRETV